MLIKKVFKFQEGFTLVEVAVVVPVMALLITVMMALLIVLVNDSAFQNKRSGNLQSQQAGLSSVAADVTNSSSFVTSRPGNFTDNEEPGKTGTYTTQGTLRNGTASSNLNTLFIYGYNQMLDPDDTTKTKVVPAFIGAPPCSAAAQSNSANIEPILIIYFVNKGTLWRRTLVDNTGLTTCGLRLINQTCSASAVCTYKDVSIVESDVTEFSITYYLNPGDTSPTVIAANAQTINIKLSRSTSDGDNTSSYTTNLRVSRAQ